MAHAERPGQEAGDRPARLERIGRHRRAVKHFHLVARRILE